MRATLLILVVLAILGCVAVSAEHEMQSAMPAEPESVSRAILEQEHMDLVDHDEDSTFFLELAQYVQDVALLEGSVEHETEADVDAEADAEAEVDAEVEAEADAAVDAEAESIDMEAEATEEQTAVTKCGKKITWERNQEPNPEAAALLESNSVTATELYSDSEADAEVEAEADKDAQAAQALEATLSVEADPNADHNPHALFKPKLRQTVPAKVAAHQSAVSQMKTLFQQAEKDYPKNVAALKEENPYLTHVF